MAKHNRKIEAETVTEAAIENAAPQTDIANVPALASVASIDFGSLPIAADMKRLPTADATMPEARTLAYLHQCSPWFAVPLNARKAAGNGDHQIRDTLRPASMQAAMPAWAYLFAEGNFYTTKRDVAAQIACAKGYEVARQWNFLAAAAVEALAAADKPLTAAEISADDALWQRANELCGQTIARNAESEDAVHKAIYDLEAFAAVYCIDNHGGKRYAKKSKFVMHDAVKSFVSKR